MSVKVDDEDSFGIFFIGIICGWIIIGIIFFLISLSDDSQENIEKRFVLDGLLEYVEYNSIYNTNVNVCIRYTDQYQYLNKYNIDIFATSYCNNLKGFNKDKIIDKKND